MHGMGVALGTRRLCDRIGAEAARDLLSASRTLRAPDALACGLATHVAAPTEWAAIVDTLLDATRTLAADAFEQLRELSVVDHRDADMAALVASALRAPGLKERMIAYSRARDDVRRKSR